MICGNIHGVVLNDRAELERLGPVLHEKPYLAPPRAPVVYQRPLASLAMADPAVPPEGLVAATTVAVLFARDASRLAPEAVPDHVGATALALDLSSPGGDYYRPALATRNGPGRLVLGAFAPPVMPQGLRLSSGNTLVHEWQLERLLRPWDVLIAEISDFCTLKAGDLLLIGLPGDAPVVHAGQELRIEAVGAGLSPIAVSLAAERGAPA